MPPSPLALRILPALAACALAVPRDADAQSAPTPEAIEEPALAAELAGAGSFAEAAEALERAAPRLPPERALTAWSNATRLRRALGDERAAAQDLDAALAVGATADPLRSRAWALVEDALSGCWLGPATAPPGCETRLREAATRLGDRPLDVAVRSRTVRAQSSQDPEARRRLAVEALAFYSRAHPQDAPGAEREVPDPLGALRLEQRRAADAERRPMRRTGSPFGGMTEAGLDNPTGEGFYRRYDPDLLEGSADDRALHGAATARRLVWEIDFERAIPQVVPSWTGAFATRREHEAWVDREVAPWIRAWIQALHESSDAAGRLRGMGVASPTLYAIVRLSERYLEFVRLLRSLPGPPDVPPRTWCFGEPSGDELHLSIAREGFQQCVVDARQQHALEYLTRCARSLASMHMGPISDERTPALQATPPATPSPAPPRARP
jgi:hypothetical protein